MNYIEDFCEALNRTEKLGLSESLVACFAPFKSEDASTCPIVISICEDLLSRHGHKFVDRKCVKAHWALKQELEAALAQQVYLTLGDVSTPWGNRIYGFNEKTMLQMLNWGAMKTYKLHCWLTLESGQIVDISLPTSLGLQMGNKQLVGDLVIGNADIQKYKYHPIVVGENVLGYMDINVSTGGVQFVTLLARLKRFMSPRFSIA
ncbi:hypothetical protein [Vibrio aestuarianus]|uniref:hypothetical protein n=1 Tax=Vibrio aestuarianus TaxID=28171 RepID=UPI0021C40D50|nr:hypothetical protein [Vibrio aestuarianus]MDE1211927.1 hypothetical protein [Vibrio aestuarianus]MDE1319797.1 hypothetical protein [Vibrio aestuarianus]CAH8242456.1 hypothetical protein VAE122_500001 [Vibrio aestuarianus]